MKRTMYDGSNPEIEQLYHLDCLNDVLIYRFEFEAKEFICREGQDLPYVLFVCSGQAKVFTDTDNGRRFLNCFYKRGGMMGDIEFFQGSLNGSLEACSSVQAMTDLNCIGFYVKENYETLLACREFIFRVGQTVARKLARASKNGAHNLLYPLEVRLCSYLDTACVGSYFTEQLTEVAQVLGTSYRHLLREIQSLVAEGI